MHKSRAKRLRSALRAHASRYKTSSLVFESFSDVPSVWHEICNSDDLGMDPKVLHVFQRTHADQCRCWGVVVFDAKGNSIGCAALCLFPTELIETTHPTVMRLRDKMRRIWPRFGRMNVLFCGLPIPSGTTHLRVRYGASRNMVIAEVMQVMQRLARSAGGRLSVFKEFEDDTSAARIFSYAGYIRGDIPPMHLLAGNFPNFDAYCNSLKSRYRAQIQRSQKKLESAGFKVLSGRGSAFFATHFNENTHRLYIAMRQQAQQKLELIPASFFLELAAELDKDVLLTLIYRDAQVHAFSFAVTRGKTHYNLYSGLDYALNNEGDLYFNLFYNDLEEAFRSGATSVHLGQTSDAFKSRLGSMPQKLHFFARTHPPALNLALRLVAPLAFPKVVSVESNDVFSRSATHN